MESMRENSIERTPSAYDSPLLIKELLRTPLVNTPDQEIVYRDQSRYSYRELGQRIGRLANALTGLGIKPGDTVAVMDWDSHRYLECYFAVPMMGAVLHHVNVRLSPEQLLYTINHAEDDIILVNVEFLPLLEQIRDRIETVKSFVLITDEKKRPQTPIEFVAEYEELLEASSPEYSFPDFNENTRATTFYTTGTTGHPKGVYFSHRQLVLHSLVLMTTMGTPAVQGRFHQEDVYMPITPMFHVHAWGVPYVATVMGVKQVYPGRYTPEGLLGLIQKEGVTFSHCVPTILQMLLSSPAVQKVDLSGWKVVIGGAALPLSLCKAAMAKGIDIWSAYGMSESCPLLTTAQLAPGMKINDLDSQAEIRCKTGRIVPLVDLRVVDEEMNDVPHDASARGEIVVRAPWLTQGYLKDPQNSEQLWQGGYLHTGDVASLDSEGWLKICDRIKDVIKTGGEWISSLELEDIISHHSAVGEVAVIGVPDAKWGERPMAILVVKPDCFKQGLEEEIRTHVQGYIDRGVIPKWGMPNRVLFVKNIDKTSVGKIDKKVLRQKYL